MSAIAWREVAVVVILTVAVVYPFVQSWRHRGQR